MRDKDMIIWVALIIIGLGEELLSVALNYINLLWVGIAMVLVAIIYHKLSDIHETLEKEVEE